MHARRAAGPGEWVRRWSAAAGVVLFIATAGLPAVLEAAPPWSPNSHVRPMDAAARRLLEAAVAGSPTVARLVAHLENSDLIVMTAVTMVPGGIAGDLRFLDATATVRILQIRVDNRQAPLEQMAWLAHELQHAVEAAEAPEVRSAAALAALMKRIGHARARGTLFDTAAAVECGRQAGQELRAAPRAQRGGVNSLHADEGQALVTRPRR